MEKYFKLEGYNDNAIWNQRFGQFSVFLPRLLTRI